MLKIGLNVWKFPLKGWLQLLEKAGGGCFLGFSDIFVDEKWLKCNMKMRKQLTFFALIFDGSGAFNLIVDLFAGGAD